MGNLLLIMHYSEINQLFNLGFVMSAAIYEKISAADTPTAQALKPPLNMPIKPSLSTASFTPFHSTLPKPKKRYVGTGACPL